MHTREPGPGHQALMRDLHGLLGRAELEGIPVIEQIVILAQLLGQKIADLPPNLYEVSDVTQAISRNMHAANQQATRGHSDIIGEVVGHG